MIHTRMRYTAEQLGTCRKAGGCGQTCCRASWYKGNVFLLDSRLHADAQHSQYNLDVHADDAQLLSACRRVKICGHVEEGYSSRHSCLAGQHTGR